MPRNQIIFLGKRYKTQTEFEGFVKNHIYNSIGICNDIKNTYPPHYDTLIEILKRHPQFISKTQNMCNIKIRKNTLNKKALEIIIINTDGSETDISWRCAITSEKKTNKHELMSAMRSSVEDQIFQFKKNNVNKCVLCHNSDNLHVDHIIFFDELAFNFIDYIKDKHIQIPDTFGDTNDDSHRRCFLETNNNFKNEWVNYHKKHATLRILCQTCNLTRIKTKNKINTIS